MVGEPREVELEGSGELTHEMVFTYLTYEEDWETGYGSGTCITSMIIGDLCTSIEDDCYAPWDEGEDHILNCTHMYFQNLVISRTVISIGDGAFGGIYGGPNITVDAANTTYDSRNNCNAIIQTSTNTLIRGCSTTVIPNSVTSIGDAAFSNSRSLSSITIPSSVTSISYGAFSECSSLSAITSLATTAPTITNTTFYNLNFGGTLYVPQGSSGYNTWLNQLGGWTKVEQ